MDIKILLRRFIHFLSGSLCTANRRNARSTMQFRDDCFSEEVSFLIGKREQFFSDQFICNGEDVIGLNDAVLDCSFLCGERYSCH